MTVVTVQPQDIPYAPNFVAQTESSRQVNIVARVSGFLDRIAYQEGEVVKEGQLLFQLDPKPFQAQLEAARGELQAQQARFTTAQANLGRVKPLAAAERAVAGGPRPRAGRIRLRQGRGLLGAGEGEGGRAEPRLHDDPLAGDRAREPLAAAAGRVRQLDVREREPHLRRRDRPDLGELQRVAEPAREVARRDRPRSWSSRRRTATTRSSSCCRTARPIRTRGKINFADPSFSQDTGSFMVRAVLPNPKRELRPGMFVTALREGRGAAGRDRRAAARGAAGLERPPRLRGEAGRHRGGAAGGGRRLLRREGHRDR